MRGALYAGDKRELSSPFSDAAKRSQGRKRDGLVDHIDAIDDGWIDDEDFWCSLRADYSGR